jgi:SH3-like domain-containing protein
MLTILFSMNIKLLIILLALNFYNFSYGSNNKELKVPRFVSLKSNKINIRKGPGSKYPIIYTIEAKDEPVEIVAEYQNWRKIKDIEGEEGWVLSNMLSGKRHVVVIKNNIFLYKNDSNKSQKVAIVEKNVRCKLHSCQNSLCNVTCGSYKGYIERVNLFGVYKNEKF